MKTRLHKKQQNCNKLLTLFTMGIAMLTGVVAMGLCTIRESYHQARAVSYDDEEYQITFSYNEYTNYIWENLCNYLNNEELEESFTNTTMLYNTGDYDVFVFDEFIYDDSVSYVSAFNNPFVYFSLSFGEGKFYTLGVENVDLVWNLNSALYNGVKTAVELDITANQPSDNMPAVLTDFVHILVNGIGQMASGVASGISAMAQALFLKVENGAVVGLSTFGGIFAIFAGLALAVAITTKVYLWITSLGN